MNQLEYEMEDLDLAFKLIERGHPSTDVDQLAHYLYKKRMSSVGIK